MTTAPLPPATRPRPVLVGPEITLAGGVTLVTGLLAVLAAALVSGAAGASGAAIGAGMVLLFFGFGALTVNLVAAISPAASLLVALLTYVLQVVAVGVTFAALQASGALGGPVDAGWVAGTLIGATVCWLTAQVVAATRSRQPLYDLPAGPGGAALRAGDGPEAGAA
jgi:ATP synthase protein I